MEKTNYTNWISFRSVKGVSSDHLKIMEEIIALMLQHDLVEVNIDLTEVHESECKT